MPGRLRGVRLDRAQIALALVGLALSVASLVSEAAELCGSCGGGSSTRLTIGAAGTVGYAGLTVAAYASFERIFQLGVLVAAAVHTALATWMASTGDFCPICVAAATAAVCNVGLGLTARRIALAHVERVYLPALLVASGVVFAVALHDGGRQKNVSQLAAGVTSRTVDPSVGVSKAAVLVVVYENDHCGYCRDFRVSYAPQLERDFGDRVALEYRDAATASWVRRTPTIAVSGGAVFEGLPVRYEHLRSAVASSLDSGAGRAQP